MYWFVSKIKRSIWYIDFIMHLRLPVTHFMKKRQILGQNEKLATRKHILSFWPWTQKWRTIFFSENFWVKRHPQFENEQNQSCGKWLSNDVLLQHTLDPNEVNFLHTSLENILLTYLWCFGIYMQNFSQFHQKL